MTSVVAALAAAAFTLTAIACGGDGATGVASPLAASLEVTVGDAQAQIVGMPLDTDVVVTVRDTAGMPVGGVSLTFVAGAGAVTPTAAATDDQGQASASWTLGTSAGAQTLEVHVADDADVSTTVTATAYADLPDSMFLFTGDDQIELASKPLPKPIQVMVVDRYGNPVPDAPITFTVTGGGSLSPDTSEVPTDLDGIASVEWTLGPNLGAESAQAVLPDSSVGDVTNLKGSPVSFTATAVAFAFDSVAPSPPVVGEPLTLYGMGFDPDSSGNVVTIDGVTATITAWTQTSLIVDVPSFGCSPEQDRTIAVTRGALSGSTTATVRPANALSLAVGQTTVLSDPADYCLQFLANGGGSDEYLVGLTATAPLNGSLAFVMTGNDGVNPPPTAPRIAAAPAVAPVSRSLSLRTWESDFFRTPHTLANPTRSAPVGPSLAPQLVPSVGDTMTYRVPNITTDPCNDFTETLATVLAVGPHVVVATDASLSPTLKAAIATALDSLITNFGGTIYNVVTEYFGVPTDNDGNGGITLLFSSVVQSLGVQTFSTAVDFTARSTCPASNESEIIYIAVPAVPTLSDLAALFAAAPPALAHDLTNVIQFARRIATGGVPLAPWLAEAQSELGTEVAGLAIRGDAQQMDYGWSVVDADSTARRWYLPRFDQLSLLYGWDGNTGKVTGAPDQCSLFGFGGISVPCLPQYAAGAQWSFLRYVGDQLAASFSGGEAGFEHALVGTDSTGDGTSALATLTGSDLSDLIVRWAMTLYADGRVTAGDAPALQITSWNLGNIFDALPVEQRLAPQDYAFQSFGRSGTVVGGGTSYTSIVAPGAHGALALRVGDAAGANLGSELHPRLWVVRMK